MSSKEWQELTWGEIATLEYGKALRSYKGSSGKIPVYGTNGLIGFTEQALCNSEGVIVGRKGAYRGVHFSDVPFYVIDTAFYLKPNKIGVFYEKWAYYKLLTQNINSMDSGSAIPSTSRPDFYALRLALPPLIEQKNIIDILTSLDNKIEMNRRINDNLELQANAIFKSWFIDFEPFGGVLPSTWDNHTLNECCSLIAKGITPQYSDSSTQKVINQKCIRDHRVDLNLARMHMPKSINDKWLKYGDILINSTGTGTLGRAAQILFSPENLTVDSHVTIVRPRSAELVNYLGLWCINQESTFEKMATGSTGQTDLPRERLKALRLLVPTPEVLKKFTETAGALFTLIIANQQENDRLAETRNILLPKLMSGEIDLSDII